MYLPQVNLNPIKASTGFLHMMQMREGAVGAVATVSCRRPAPADVVLSEPESCRELRRDFLRQLLMWLLSPPLLLHVLPQRWQVSIAAAKTFVLMACAITLHDTNLLSVLKFMGTAHTNYTDSMDQKPMMTSSGASPI